MSKRRYTSVGFKGVDWQALRDRVGGGGAVLAVDVAKEDFVAALLAGEQGVLKTFKWVHPQQTAEVVERLAWLGQDLGLEAVMEPSGTYGDALGWQLQRAGIALYRVSPKRVHDAAEVYDGVPSLHDAKAAELIGRLHLQGVSQRWREPTAERRELTALLEVDSATLCALIARYGDTAALRADAPGAVALMRRVGRAGLSEEKRQQLLASAQHSVGVPCLAAERELLQWLAADLIETRQRLRELEREVECRVVHTPTLRRLAEVVGKVSAAVLVAALGSPTAYPNAASYTKALGLNLKERSSGKHRGQLKITKRGPSVGRYYVFFAALRLIAHEPVVKRWYLLKTNRPGALKNKTVIELMRKLSKALWHVAHGERFDVEKLFNLKAVAGA